MGLAHLGCCRYALVINVGLLDPATDKVNTARISVRPRQMGNALTTFDFNSNSIRVIDRDGELWFCGADVMAVLYGKTSGMGNVYGPLAADEKTKVKRSHLGMSPGRDACLIAESGLYKLIMRSNKTEARAFQDWVTRVVLPAIRKDGYRI